MNEYGKMGCGVIGISGLLYGGSAIGLSLIDKFKDKKRFLQVIGVAFTVIGIVFTAIFADANLYPEDDIDDGKDAVGVTTIK